MWIDVDHSNEYRDLQGKYKNFESPKERGPAELFDSFDNDEFYQPRGLDSFPPYCGNHAKDLQILTSTSWYTIDFSIFLHNAFLDNRTGENIVRIIAVIHSTAPKPRIWCHFRNGSKGGASYVTSPIDFYEMNENHKFLYGGWIVSCRVPRSLARSPCDVFVSKYETHDYRSVQLPLRSIEPRKLQKMRINVCVSPIFGNVSYARLVEFIELSRLMGADHFTFYSYDVPKKLTEVLQYYTRLDIVTVLPWTLPIPPGLIWYNGQVVSINDCLYRSMPFFSHVAFIDLDEMIVPQNSIFSWKEILTASNDDRFAGYSFVSAPFPAQSDLHGLPGRSYLLTLLTTNRSTTLDGIRSKVIVLPYRVFEMGIHHVSRPWPDEQNYAVVQVNPKTAILNHYISGQCRLYACSQFVIDQTIPRKYSKALKKSFYQVLHNISPNFMNST
ncbi:hypothetical protein FSP39_022708 [Pinctada imbricata]|uniref:Glycosyltransferase family 92 protein n=1 Tax=Pinctada imbricata TaxID=66713 RepID=A0AA88Y1P2_PINIB|nr:hypothetical protein FSP39_022708 [Pinctada imbricata]